MHLNKQLIAILMLSLMSGTGQLYASSQLDDVDVEFVQMTAEQQMKLEDEVKQNQKLAEEYGLNVKAEVVETPQVYAQGNTPEVKQATPASSTDFRKNVAQARETEVWQKNNFLEMRVALEKLTNTQVNSSGPNGMMYTTYGSDLFGGDWENKSTKDLDYTWGVGNKYMYEWMGYDQVQKELAQLASLTFKDVKGTEWYAKHIPTAVYYGLINGYPDGTFKGNAPVSRAEFGVMSDNYSRQFVKDSSVAFAEKLTAHKNQWYYTSVEVMGGGPMGLYALTVNDMNSGMTRGEVAMIMASGYFDNEFISEYESVSKSSFKDITNISKTLVEMTDSQRRTEYMKQLKTPNSCPKEVVASLNVLKAKGVMVGDANGNSNWTKTVTRGEVVALFERCARLEKTK